jgi:hypothetical protein
MSHPEKQPPLGITITQKGPYVEIVYTRPRNFEGLSILIFLGFISTMFLSGARTNNGLSLMALLVFICFFGIAYYQLIMAFNKIHIFITPKKLIVRYKPFFQWGNREIPLSHIKLITNDTKNFFDRERKEHILVELRAVKYGGQREQLLTTSSLEHAEYIQQKIMLYLADL